MKASVNAGDIGHSKRSQRVEYERCKNCKRRVYRNVGEYAWKGTPTEDGCKCAYPNRTERP